MSKKTDDTQVPGVLSQKQGEEREPESETRRRERCE